jgi:Zn-dependent protease
MNFFHQGIPLGRWFGITVVIHWTFLLYAAFELFGNGIQNESAIELQALALGLLFATVLLHEFGHALSCIAVGGQAHHIVLWPLGGIAFVQPPQKAWAWLVTTLCGPLVNAILWPIFYLLSKYLVERQFGADTWIDLSQYISLHPANFVMGFSYPIDTCLYLWQINKLLLLFNLIPAYPMDGGRLLQELLWFVIGYGKSLQIAGMVGTVAGAAFIVLGLGLQQITLPLSGIVLGDKPSGILLLIGALCVFESFGIYKRSHEIAGWRKN